MGRRMALVLMGLTVASFAVYLAPEEKKAAWRAWWEGALGEEPGGAPLVRKKIRIAVYDAASGTRGLRVKGTVKVEYPLKAGLTDQRFEIVVPGQVEFLGGPSGYEVRLANLTHGSMYFEVYVDDTRLVAGDRFGSTLEERGVTFTIKPDR